MSIITNFKNITHYFITIISILIVEQGVSQNFDSKTIIVKLKQQNSSFFKNKQNVQNLGVDIKSYKSISHNTLKSKTSIQNIYKLYLNNNNSIPTICKKLYTTGLFEYCEPVHLEKILYTPSDARSSGQYTLAIVKAYDAWDIDKGDSTIVIGVTDTGIDFSHEDLRSNIFYNVNDPIDGVDNDFDGYIDNYMGWDFGSNDNNPQWNESGTSGNAIHGTFTAGLAGARTDNNLGIASLGFSNKILPIKISNNYGGISTGYEAIIYAAEHGCKIINCSWGSTSPSNYGRDVIKYVTEDLGVIIVAAAGNDNNENLFYPASYDNVVSVAASNRNDNKWPNSSYNWRVDISAPGQDVLSTLSNSTYGTSSGTSFSSPIVASALALLLSYYPDTLSNKQLIEILKVTSDKIDTISSNSAYINKLGNGRLNLFNALQDNWGPSLSYQNFDVLKNGHNAYGGDTAIFSGYIINYLEAAQNINITISSESQYIDIIDSTFSVSNIGESDSINVGSFYLKLFIHNDIPNNKNVIFKITINSDYYQNTEERIHNFVFPSIEFNKNRIHTTLFPEAKIAYNYNSQGFGLTLDQLDNILYEFGIVTGYSEENTIANVRSYQDFQAQNFLDSTSQNNQWFASNRVSNETIVPLNIDINYETFDDSLYQNFIFIHYRIINNSTVEYPVFYFGLFADWDINQYYSNYTSIDTNLRLAITRSFSSNTSAALQLLSPYDWNRFALDNMNGNTIIDSRNGFSRNEFYYGLTNSNYFVGIEDNGTDVLDFLSTGPFFLDPNDTLNLTFAILADTTEEKIINSGIISKQLYDSLYGVNIGIREIINKNGFKIFPNPTSSFLNIVFDVKSPIKNKNIQIYNSSGQLLIERKLTNNLNISNLESGIYLIKIGNRTKRFIVD